jgi:hypothetical protein
MLTSFSNQEGPGIGAHAGADHDAVRVHGQEMHVLMEHHVIRVRRPVGRGERDVRTLASGLEEAIQLHRLALHDRQVGPVAAPVLNTKTRGLRER